MGCDFRCTAFWEGNNCELPRIPAVCLNRVDISLQECLTDFNSKTSLGMFIIELFVYICHRIYIFYIYFTEGNKDNEDTTNNTTYFVVGAVVAVLLIAILIAVVVFYRLVPCLDFISLSIGTKHNCLPRRRLRQAVTFQQYRSSATVFANHVYGSPDDLVLVFVLCWKNIGFNE